MQPPTDRESGAAGQHSKSFTGAPPPFRHSILCKYGVFVTIVVILSLGIMGHLAYIFARDILRDNIDIRLQVVASDRAALLEGYVREQLERASLVTSRTHLRELVQEFESGEIDGETFRGQSRHALADAKSVSGEFLDLWITDTDGNSITATSDNYLNRTYADAPAFLQAKERPRLDFPQQVDGEYYSYLTAPMKDEEGQLLGVLMIWLDVSFLEEILTDSVGLEESGSVLVGVRQGDQARYLFPPRNADESTVELRQVPAMVKALSGETGTDVETYSGTEVLAAFHPISSPTEGDAPWGLVAKMDLSEAYAPVSRLRNVLFGLQVALVMTGMGLSFFVVRRFTKPILRLTSTATRIAQGNLHDRVPIRSKDEIGLLGTAFNRMSAELEASRAQLEERIEQRTRELESSREKLHQQTLILRSILDSMGDGVIVTDRDGNFLVWNPAAEHTIGVGPQDIDPQKWSQVYGCYLPDGVTLCPSEDLPLTRAIRGESLDNCELFMRNPDVPQGVWISVTARPLKNEQDELCGGVVVFRDISESRAAQEELKMRDEKNQAILATTHEAFVGIDETSTIFEWNDQAAATFGWSRDEAIGRLLTETIIPEKYREPHLHGIEHFLRTGEGAVLNRRLELSALHRDGHEFPVELTIAPVEQGDHYLFAAFVHDITEEKEAEEELKRAKEAAEDASRAKSAFLATMSHEIRTPMNAVIGMTELLLDTKLTPTQREYLTMVQESGELLLSVINDILDFSKIEAGRFELDHSPFALRECLGDTMKVLAIRAHRKQLELAFHLGKDVPDAVTGDQFRLRQIIVNLVGNAIKFTDTGEIVLDVSLDSQTDHDVRLHFVVRDTGIGIPKDEQQRIFEAFEQVDESMARRFHGTGLGLAISSRLVELMGGRIWVTSEVGKGSEFHFIAQFELAHEKIPSATLLSHEDLHGLRVLVVDDNFTNRQILEEMLENWDMQVRTTSRGEDVLSVMQEMQLLGTPIDLVLLDAQMPGMNGFETTESIKTNHQLRSPVIMMLSSSDRNDELSRCKELGIAAYLIKPIKQSELFNAIGTTLGVHRAVQPDQRAKHVLLNSKTGPLKILLVEDSLVNQKLALALLKPQGHDITVASNGREAVEQRKSQHFDLILMDVQMPEMDGLEATRQIRQYEQQVGEHVPIIAMTAHAMEGDRDQCLEAGMDDYVSKPVRFNELHDAINRAFNPDSEEETTHSMTAAEEPAAEKPSAETQQASAATPLEEEPSQEQAASSDGAIHWQDAMEKSQISEEELCELGQLFLEEAPKMLSEIRDALDHDDARSLHRAAHTLKSSSALFEAHSAAETAKRVELLGKEEKLAEARDVMPRLEKEVDRVIAAVADHLESSRTVGE